ncbi:MAG: precorrin-2 C(20)-methyltransferase [Peptococcaceae bacterium]|nr:precorrin-2 C(20)-methyltransferase [Peptococcaceae bacterium]
MLGKLYGVGVGPGDPELLTLKAVKIIKEAEVIALPRTDEKNITSLEIVKAVVDISQKEIIELYMPMTRDEDVLSISHQKAAYQLAEILIDGKNIAFLTLGDPAIYSTYIYLHQWMLQAGFQAQIIPGVPSFCAVAAKLNDSLCKGDEPLHIIPASYEDNEDYLDWKGTKVLMKSGKALGKVIKALREKGLLEYSSLVERCGMDGEKVYVKLSEVQGSTSYFSTIVVKDKECKS